MTDPGAIDIRPLRTIEEYAQAEEVQILVWQMGGEREIVPKTIMLPISKTGGLVMGAFDGEQMIGICIGLLARTAEGRVYHWSHITGVVDKGRGLGERIKWAQREAVLAMGLDLIRWTTDPLEGMNASLNFGKLGVTCCTYTRNHYGEIRDGLNTGIESDRFTVDWHIDSERVKSRLAEGKPQLSAQALSDEGAESANPTEIAVEGIRRIHETKLDLASPRVLIETPASYQAIKVHDLTLAISWRMQTRALFEAYFGKDYVAKEFISEFWDGERRSFFLLERA